MQQTADMKQAADAAGKAYNNTDSDKDFDAFVESARPYILDKVQSGLELVDDIGTAYQTLQKAQREGTQYLADLFTNKGDDSKTKLLRQAP